MGRIHFIAKSNFALKKFAGGRGESGTLRSTKSEESLTSLHNVEGNYSLASSGILYIICIFKDSV